MSELTIKQLLQTMSLDGILDVVEIIRDRQDVASIIVLTEKDLIAMEAQDARHFRGLANQIEKDYADEPA